MADFQRVVEYLRDFRQGPLQGVTEELAQAAADYAALCQQANDRLRQCSAFLQQGLRTEAIHHAEESPNLLDLVAALDLPDPQAWTEFCQNNGLPVPPPMQLDRAAQLNEAYALDQPLEHLLAQHRLLALSRAPVRDRLDTLRKIAQIDAANATWEKDIRVFEKARLRELPTAFYNAVKNRDESAIGGLMEEINRRNWFEPVPADLSTAVADAFSRMQRASIEADLQKLVAPLRDAFAAHSLQECQALAQRWKHIVTTAGVSHISTQLTDEIKPVLAFINEQSKRDEYLKRFRESCKNFTRLLDQDASDVLLEAGYARLREFREEIPEDLTRRYMNRKTARRTTADRGHRARLLAIAAGAVIILILGLIIVRLVTLSSAAKSWASKIDAAVARHSMEGLSDGQRYVEDLEKTNPDMLKEPVVATAVARLRTLASEYARDGLALQDWIRRSADLEKSATTVAANPDASAGEIVLTVSALQKALDDAHDGKDLAWVDADKRIPPTLAGLQRGLDSIRGRVGVSVRKELDVLNTRLDALPTTSTTLETVADSRSQIAAITDRLDVLRTMPALDEDTRIAINSFGLKLTQRRTAIEATRTIADELEILRRQATSDTDIRQGLEAFARRFPHDPRAEDFTAAAARIPADSAISGWQTILTGYAGAFAPSSAAEAQKRIDAIGSYTAACPGSPFLAPLRDYRAYLVHATEALADNGTWQTAFKSLLDTPMLTDLAYVEVSDGRRYYVLGDMKRVEHRMNEKVSVSFESINLNDLSKRNTITIDPPLTVSPRPIPMPHTKFVADLSEAIKLVNDRNWDSLGIDIADRLVKNDQIDIVVRAILLQQALKTEDQVAGWALGDVYSKVASDLARQSPEQLAWYDPSKVGEPTRHLLKQILDTLPPAASVRQTLADAKSKLFKSISFDLAGVGILLREDSGWSVASRSTPPAESLLWTIIPAPSSTLPSSPPGIPAIEPASTSGPAPVQPRQFQLIGRCTGGKFSLDEPALRNLPQGSIVYITNP